MTAHRASAWLVIWVGVSAALHVGKLPPTLPVLREQLGMSLVQAGFLLSMVQTAGMLMGVLVGSIGSISTTQPKRLCSFSCLLTSNRSSCSCQRYPRPSLRRPQRASCWVGLSRPLK